jgi:hypothetical protein
MLGEVKMECFGFTIDLKPCPYEILISMNGFFKNQGSIKQEVVIQINPHILIYYTMVQAQSMIMHVMSYDVLVGGTIL